MATALQAPFREGLARERVPAPAAIVIFGATGDLAGRKLIPALYNLKREGLLPAHWAVVGYARKELTNEAFASMLLDSSEKHLRTPLDPALWQDFAEGLFFVPGDFADPAAMKRLAGELGKVDEKRGTAGNRLFYFATPPSYYPVLFEALGKAGLLEEKDGRYARVIVEKPFGRDLESARALNEVALQAAQERQIYRIDHYLGKETVQNILVFRFCNAIFEPLWNQKYVDHVQITVAESIGVEGRGRFYEEAGALRDIVQNHVLQLVSLVAMEPPAFLDEDAIRDEKVKVLNAVAPLVARDSAPRVVRGQYGAGSVAGEDVVAYRAEEGVAKDSVVETYVAIQLAIDNWRWAGVPFFLRAGKRLPKRVTEIAVQFKAVPHVVFRGAEGMVPEPNVLALRIQPEEGISLKFGAKVPGGRMRIEPVKMDFLYGSSFGMDPPEAYERLLLDALLGDSTLFIRKDEVEAAWAIVTPVLEAWADEPPPALPNYEAGAWGPEAAHALLARTGREWRRP